MKKFLMIGFMIVMMSLLSCGSGLIATIASAVLPFFATIGVGLMTINVLVPNGPNQNILAGVRQADPIVALAGFMNLMLGYGGRAWAGLFEGMGRAIAWAIPGAAAGGVPPAGPLPPAPPVLAAMPPPAAAAAPPSAIHVHLYLHLMMQNQVRYDRPHRAQHFELAI